jgi:hypothetical protein
MDFIKAPTNLEEVKLLCMDMVEFIMQPYIIVLIIVICIKIVYDLDLNNCIVE